MNRVKVSGIHPDMNRVATGDSLAATIKRAFAEFLLLPTAIVVVFIALSYFTYSIDHLKLSWLQPLRRFLREHFFSSSEATSSLPGAIVSGSISVTTLTTTLLLVIVQQSAGSMTTQVFDQFLRRRVNQFYLGFFIGLALFSMITLATVDAPFNPVFGATTAFSLTGIALYLLVLLMYTTINQMRPSEIINAIYDRILKARERQMEMMAYTTPGTPPLPATTVPLLCEKGGFLTGIGAKDLSAFIARECPGSLVVFAKPVGAYFSLHQKILDMVPGRAEDAARLEAAVRRHITINIQRDIDFDATYGIEQLETISWTSVSTAKSNPAPGVMCVHTMHNILSCWAGKEAPVQQTAAAAIYYPDDAMEELMRGFENLAVVSSESMQHQVFVGVLNTFTRMLPMLPAAWQARMERAILIMLSVMGDHVLTTALRESLVQLTEQLRVLHRTDTANAVSRAMRNLDRSVGKLNSRSTRVRWVENQILRIGAEAAAALM